MSLRRSVRVPASYVTAAVECKTGPPRTREVRFHHARRARRPIYIVLDQTILTRIRAQAHNPRQGPRDLRREARMDIRHGDETPWECVSGHRGGGIEFRT